MSWNIDILVEEKRARREPLKNIFRKKSKSCLQESNPPPAAYVATRMTSCGLTCYYIYWFWFCRLIESQRTSAAQSWRWKRRCICRRRWNGFYYQRDPTNQLCVIHTNANCLASASESTLSIDPTSNKNSTLLHHCSTKILLNCYLFLRYYNMGGNIKKI